MTLLHLLYNFILINILSSSFMGSARMDKLIYVEIIVSVELFYVNKKL